jgi:hypothetical protein
MSAFFSGFVCVGVVLLAGNIDECRSAQPPYQDEPLLYEKFPSKFAWAVATAAYQIEGAWNVDGEKSLTND